MPGFSRGFTLVTRATKRWSREEFEENDKRERRTIFFDFSMFDEGRSREHVCTFHVEDEAKEAAAVIRDLMMERPDFFDLRDRLEGIDLFRELRRLAQEKRSATTDSD